ncbi:MAG: hypothetical protein C0425_06115 [Chlorobiaceae bacterium]|nr:hypothetical protein [Chlorobiaceae bacterium]MBA4309895.1 hypothetical protein [Chlorobiaceae bacterium]
MEKILIIDDDLNLCKVLQEELSNVGYLTSFYTNPVKALEHLATDSVDLVLLDLKMPEMDGFTVLQKLKNKNPDYKIIVLTAYADVKSAIDAVKIGASDFISKPYDFDELLITIRKVLQKDD